MYMISWKNPGKKKNIFREINFTKIIREIVFTEKTRNFSQEEKARRAMLDAAKLADELRAEQEAAQGLEHDRKDLETRAHEMQVSLDEAEANAIKWGRKMVAKLETR